MYTLMSSGALGIVATFKIYVCVCVIECVGEREILRERKCTSYAGHENMNVVMRCGRNDLLSKMHTHLFPVSVMYIFTYGHLHTDTDSGLIQTDRQMNGRTDGQTDRQNRRTSVHTDAHKHTQRNRESKREKEGHAHTHTHTYTCTRLQRNLQSERFRQNGINFKIYAPSLCERAHTRARTCTHALVPRLLNKCHLFTEKALKSKDNSSTKTK